MKKQLFLFLPLFTIAGLCAQQPHIQDATHEIARLQQQSQLTQNQQQMVTVGTNFANIVFNALSIIANKDDAQALGNNLSGIVNSLVSIAVEASKKPINTDVIDELIKNIKTICNNLSEEDFAHIKAAIAKRVKELE